MSLTCLDQKVYRKIKSDWERYKKISRVRKLYTRFIQNHQFLLVSYLFTSKLSLYPLSLCKKLLCFSKNRGPRFLVFGLKSDRFPPYFYVPWLQSSLQAFSSSTTSTTPLSAYVHQRLVELKIVVCDIQSFLMPPLFLKYTKRSIEGTKEMLAVCLISTQLWSHLKKILWWSQLLWKHF